MPGTVLCVIALRNLHVINLFNPHHDSQVLLLPTFTGKEAEAHTFTQIHIKKFAWGRPGGSVS